MGWFTIASLIGAGAAWLAALSRGRAYGTFVGVLLSIHTASSVALFDSFERVAPLYAYLQGTVYLHFALLAWARLRPFAYRALVSVPASYFSAATFLGAPWALSTAFGVEPVWPFLAHGVALVGLFQSLTARREIVRVALDGAAVPALARHPHGAGRVARPLRIVQLTDTHLGPFMSPARLRGFAERAVAAEPDLVFLTGDFLTMESHHATEELIHAFEPLRALEGRVFACHGNHDHEAPKTVARALRAVGARLLVDDAATVETGAGRVQIVGMDFAWRDRARRHAEVCARFPRDPEALRLVLLHDPGAFRHLPDGEADLVFAGHTHGGQLGLVSLGLRGTVVSLMSQVPDHGLWALGRNRLYVHRGTGHYGFPLRLGVPAEESVVEVHVLLAPPEAAC